MTEPGRLEVERAVITGECRGIGAPIARRLAADGAAVAINYVSDASSADALVAELTADVDAATTTEMNRSRLAGSRPHLGRLL